ncbi:MAG: response regulator transcription factor [Chitinophagaceae bacterium]
MTRILIADDHELVRRGLRQILLEKFSFAHIEEVADGRQLVQKALSEPWDIVISDIAMPQINGIEALRLIKDKVPSLPVLILSIHAGEQ